MDTVHPQRAPVWTPAWRQQLHPITVSRTSLRPQPRRYLLLPRLERRSRRFSRGSARLPVPVMVLPIPRLLLRVSTPHPLVTTPPLATGLPCMMAITGDTLDTAPPYNNTPGDNIFKRQIVITGVCFLPCYTVLILTYHGSIRVPGTTRDRSIARSLKYEFRQNPRSHGCRY